MLENHVDFIYVHKRGSILWMNFFLISSLPPYLYIQKNIFSAVYCPISIGRHVYFAWNWHSLVCVDTVWTQSEIKGKMHWIIINYNLNKVIKLNTRLLSMSPINRSFMNILWLLRKLHGTVNTLSQHTVVNG